MDKRILCDVDLGRKLDGNYHLGHIILESFRKKRPGDIAQINGDTDEKETYVSLLHRTVRLARSLTNFGCRPGDVIALSGTNHLDLGVPFYAGMINGLPICGIDPAFDYAGIKSAIHVCKPKIAFCDYTNKENYVKVAKELNINMTVVTFFDGELTMQKFVEKYDDNSTSVDDYIPPYFDPNKIYAWLMTTSGSTGLPKFVAVKQATVPAALPSIPDLRLGSICTNDGEQHVTLLHSPLQWVSSYVTKMMCIFGSLTLLMTTLIDGHIDNIIDIINKYKPQSSYGGGFYIWSKILQKDKPCVLTCFRSILLNGSKNLENMTTALKKRINPNAMLLESYGQSEVIGFILISIPGLSPQGSCGKKKAGVQLKLIDENGKEITEPHVPGELIYKGLNMFDGYYNNPKETAKSFTKDGWLKTGDVLYRDENDNYFFVERLKMIFKYRTTTIIPGKIDDLIRQHPGVLDVCVTSIDHPIENQWPVAVVVRRPGSHVTAQEIKDIVTENLPDGIELRGGVVFVEKLPHTFTRKVDRTAVRNIAATASRE